MSKNAGKAAVRCTAIDMSGLAAQEAHGKRLDEKSKQRVIRDASPLVYGSLDLRPAYDAHIKGVRQNSAAKKSVLHFVVRFPPELLAGDKLGHFDGDKEARQKMMLRQAVQFVNQTHGGHAVFAARVDRDETGETVVDVFAAPRYEKRTKRTPDDEFGEIWASATKYGKELAMKHAEEIHRRHPKAKANNLTSPRMVGIALQSEFAEWFKRINGVPLAPKVEKGTSAPDRLEKEAHDRIQRRADIQARWDSRRSRRLDAKAEALEAERVSLDRERSELDLKVRAIDDAGLRVEHAAQRLSIAEKKVSDREKSVSVREDDAEARAAEIVSTARSDAKKIIAEADAIQHEATMEAMKITLAAHKERDFLRAVSSSLQGFMKRIGRLFGSDLGPDFGLGDMLSDLQKIDRALSSAEKSAPETDRPDF